MFIPKTFLAIWLLIGHWQSAKVCMFYVNSSVSMTSLEWFSVGHWNKHIGAQKVIEYIELRSKESSNIHVM